MPDSIALLLAQSQPWFQNYGLAGAVLGGGAGLYGAVYGTCVGVMAALGKGKSFILALHWLGIGLGVTLLGAGVVALAVGQPYGVWFVLILPGAILVLVLAPMTPVIRLRYRQAEQRRLEAEEFRRG
jgi:hypothetical protein